MTNRRAWAIALGVLALIVAAIVLADWAWRDSGPCTPPGAIECAR